MIEFTLFGFPIRIRPIFWLGMAFLGGALRISNTSDLLMVALFMIAGTLTILIHELGHAFAGRWLGQASASIDMVFLGAFTQYYHPRFGRHGRALSTLAGPLATLIPGIVALIAIAFYVGGNLELTGVCSWFLSLNPWMSFQLAESLRLPDQAGTQLYFIGCLLFTSFWWTVLNLLPIFPLDGGQIMGEYMKSPRRMHLISMIFATIIGIVAFNMGAWLLAVFMVMFVFDNFKNMKNSPF